MADDGASGTFASDWRAFAVETQRSFEDFASASARVARDASARATAASMEVVNTSATLARETSSAMAHVDRDRVIRFSACALASAFAYGLGFFVGLPTLPLAPAKFGLCFTTGTLCSLAAVGALRGMEGQVKHMTSEARLPSSVALLITTGMTLRAALWMHSYVMTVFWSVLQAFAVVHYQVSYFPYGRQGLRATVAVATQIASPACGACFRALGFTTRSNGVLPV